MTAGGGADKLRVGVVIPNNTTDGVSVPAGEIFRYVERAEELGLDSVWTIEHFFAAPPSYRMSRFDPLTTLAAVAARTERIGIGTAVLLLPLYNPIYIAKMAATIDYLSSGRMTLGVGIGWSPKEFAMTGVPLAERGRRMAEGMTLLRRLFSEEGVTFEGRYWQVEDVTIEPRPVQRPGPPLLYGGGTLDPDLCPPDYPQQPSEWNIERVLKRIARVSDGIMTAYRSFPLTSAARAETDWERICEYARGYGRDPAALQRMHLCHFHVDPAAGSNLDSARRAVAAFTHQPFDYTRKLYALGTPQDVAEVLRNWIATSGIRRFIFNPITDHVAQIELLAREVLPRVRD